jgi:hypothetical protein
MGTPVYLLLATLGIVMLWLQGARAREFATVLTRRHCDTRGLQLLDETVGLERIGLRWTSDGIKVRRMYRFEFSLEGVGRRNGYILLLGTRLETIDDGLPKASQQPPIEGSHQREDTAAQDTDATGGHDDKVVPFKRPKR